VLAADRGVVAVSEEGKYLLPLRDGRVAFVKVSRSDQPWRRRQQREGWAREKTCLEVLSGLAIPSLIPLTPRQLPPSLRPAADAQLLAIQAQVGFEDLDRADLSPAQLVAAWLFVVEQLVAFRRHQVIYTDVKCNNVLARRRPFAVTLIDFDRATALVKGRRRLGTYGYTAGFQAPETARGAGATERSLVFQAGILLPHILMHTANHDLRAPRRGLARLRPILAELGCDSLVPVVSRCVARRPQDRPRNYEEVLKAISRVPLGEEVRALRETLRRPYAARLAGVGL